MAGGTEDQAKARLAKGLALWAVGGAAFVAAPWLVRRKVRPQVAPDGPVVGLRFDNGERAPILIVHDGRDALIPKEMSDALFAAAGEPKQYLYLAGVPHAQLNGTGLGEVRHWLAGVMDAE